MTRSSMPAKETGPPSKWGPAPIKTAMLRLLLGAALRLLLRRALLRRRLRARRTLGRLALGRLLRLRGARLGSRVRRGLGLRLRRLALPALGRGLRGLGRLLRLAAALDQLDDRDRRRVTVAVLELEHAREPARPPDEPRPHLVEQLAQRARLLHHPPRHPDRVHLAGAVRRVEL